MVLQPDSKVYVSKIITTQPLTLAGTCCPHAACMLCCKIPWLHQCVVCGGDWSAVTASKLGDFEQWCALRFSVLWCCGSIVVTLSSGIDKAVYYTEWSDSHKIMSAIQCRLGYCVTEQA